MRQLIGIMENKPHFTKPQLRFTVGCISTALATIKGCVETLSTEWGDVRCKVQKTGQAENRLE